MFFSCFSCPTQPRKAWRMRSLLIITSLSSLTISGPSVYTPEHLSLSPCGLFSALHLFSLHLPPSPDVTSVPLNKSIFPSCCSCVFSWGLGLLSFSRINKRPPHPMSPYRFLQHHSVLSSVQFSTNDLQKSLHGKCALEVWPQKHNCSILPAVQ